MTRFILAALALASVSACACSPAMAEAASEPVTWDALGAVLGWIGFVALILGGLFIAVVVIGGIIMKAWSH